MQMSRREQWHVVLDAEIKRWEIMSYEELVSQLRLRDSHVYQIEVDSKEFQVEVELIELTEEYAHIVVSVDDGSLPASIIPATRAFVRWRKSGTHGDCSDS